MMDRVSWVSVMPASSADLVTESMAFPNNIGIAGNERIVQPLYRLATKEWTIEMLELSLFQLGGHIVTTPRHHDTTTLVGVHLVADVGYQSRVPSSN